MNWKDIGVRAGKTFLQAFIAVLIASEIKGLSDFVQFEMLDQAAVAGLAAFLSFVQNVLNQLSTE